MSALRRVRLAGAWLLGLYFATLYVRLGWGQLESDGLGAEAFAHERYPPWFRMLVGGIEVVGGAALIIPQVASYAALALSLIMAGALGALAHEHRWADVVRVIACGAGLTWIVYEWWWRRLGGRTQAMPPAQGTA